MSKEQHAVMAKANQLKRVIDKHGLAEVSKINREHLRRFLGQIIRDIEKVE